MLHHLNETEHGADDSDGRGVAACRLKHFCGGLLTLLLDANVEFHHLADFLQVGTVHREVQRFAQERILHGFGILLEGDDTALAGLRRVGDDLLDTFFIKFLSAVF
jgi:hypothetical protein